MTSAKAPEGRVNRNNGRLTATCTRDTVIGLASRLVINQPDAVSNIAVPRFETFPPAGFVGLDVRLPRFAASSSSGWRRRAEIEVVLLLQSSDDGRHVDKLDLRRPHFRFDSVQLPCPTLRPAVRTNRYRLRQRGQLLQLGEQFLLDAVDYGAPNQRLDRVERGEIERGPDKGRSRDRDVEGGSATRPLGKADAPM
jgi:hypothetical protein